MKITSVQNTNTKRQNFNGIGNFMVGVNDAILKGGFAASIISQDVIGAILPRVGTGLTRNSDKTGHLNYEFATLEAAREGLTGPPIFLLPFAAFNLVQKKAGGTIKTPVKVIEALSEKAKNICGNEVKSAEQYKDVFYSSAWNDALKNTCGKDYQPSEDLLKKVSGYMKELETSKDYTLKDRMHKVPKFRTTKDIVADISNLIKEEIKSNADVKQSFSKIVFKDGLGKSSTTSVVNFAERMSSFVKDSVKHIGNDFSNPEKVLQKINTFKNKKIGGRVVANFAILGTALIYATQVPKIYKAFNKTNPGLIGLVEDEHKNVIVKNDSPVNYVAFKEYKKIKNKPSFRGLEKIAKAVMKEGKVRKFAEAFEFNGGDMSFWSVMTVLFGGTVFPRVLNAYDKHDKREILTRDVLTIGTIVAGAKTLQKCIVRMFEKKSGFSLSEKVENYAQQSKGKKILDHIRPFAGVQVFSNEDIIAKYSNIDKFKNGVAGFCEYVANTGGNIVKLFGNDTTTKDVVEQMVGKSLNKTTQEEIISAVKDKKNSIYVQKIVDAFKKPDNNFIKKAKSVNGVFGFMSTFIAVPAFMIFLQKLNEYVTKKAIAKEQAEKKIVDQKFIAIKLTSDMIQPDASTLYMK